MTEWMLGFVAEAAYYIARFHERRCDRLIARSRRAHETAERWSRLQQWADRVDGPFDVEGVAS